MGDLEDIDGIPLYRSDNKDLESLSAFGDTPLGEYFETELTENPLYQMSNEVVNESPFGENSLFFEGIRQSYGKLENEINGVWVYSLKQSKSGQDLIDEYKKYDSTLAKSEGMYDSKTDLIIYLEDDYKVDLGKVLLTKMSNAMRREYNEHLKSGSKKDILLSWGKSIVANEKGNTNFKATAQDIKNAFLIEIEYREIQDRNEFKISNVEFTDKIFEGISDAFRELKLSRKRWDPTLDSDKYLFHSVTKAIEFLQGKIAAAINLLNKVIKKLEVVKLIMSLTPARFVYDFQLINNIIRFLKLLSANLKAIHILLSHQKYEKPLSFAFWCGVYNGSIEFIGGILDIILLVIKLYVYKDTASSSEFKIDVLSLKEGLEELIEKFIENPDLLVEAIEKYYKERYEDEGLTDYQTSHNFGEDLILAIDLVVSIITVVKGLGKLAAKLPKFTRWIDDILTGKGKGVKRIKQKLINFKFVGFAKSFDNHISRGNIRIQVKNAKTGEILETYEYAPGKGGRSSGSFTPPQQVKKQVSGLHRHFYIDNKNIRIKQVYETKLLPNSHKVDIVEIEFYIKELNKWVRKDKKSTLWPRSWSMRKIKRLTKEASENILWNRERKFIGKSKNGLQIEFFVDKNGEIVSSYLNFDKL